MTVHMINQNPTLWHAIERAVQSDWTSLLYCDDNGKYYVDINYHGSEPLSYDIYACLPNSYGLTAGRIIDATGLLPNSFTFNRYIQDKIPEHWRGDVTVYFYNHDEDTVWIEIRINL